ncbi:helix-turn-helix domain-containing protein [Polaromonas sp.]|uniref:helix-turn-helix domain-containing protein n=1 Tax=Polaromonas sp. TaxID=1869339 RepID=UPI002730FFE6|nr:helix-turn-helix transcriptional regulator [Polaromonas sp.]MDP2451816.1 helix-turn-helix transcriptional regulator [Polaromonas sp.]MDP3755986.1 helix-turn-helix transcriptional regulator [Polaromonas sp.]
MARKAEHQNKFSKALRQTRAARGLPQEAFSLVSSRTYVSSLERGLKSPTLLKVDALAEVLEVHPLTLLTLAYVDHKHPRSADALVEGVLKELHLLLAREKI